MDVVPKLLVAFLAGSFLLFAGMMPAAGHASLVSTDPADGSQIATPPPSVKLTFSEDLESGMVAVSAPDGARVTTSEPRLSGPQMVADLAQSDQHGTYTVAYRVVTGDGHPVTGAFTFTTTEGRHVTQRDAPASASFVERNGSLLLAGLVVAVLAIALMLSPLVRGRHE
jgi:copper resistance protein C